MKRRHLLQAGLVSQLPTAWPTPTHAAEAPLVEEPRLLKPTVLFSPRPGVAGSGEANAEFTPRKGTMWLLAHVVGLVEGSAINSGAVFEVFLNGLAMSPTDTVIFVRARRMRAPVAAVWPRDEAGKPRLPLTRQSVNWKQRTSELAALEAGLRGEVDLRQVAVLHSIDLREVDITHLSVTLKRSSGVRPLFVELQPGQGPLPRELAAFAEQVNGPWLWRHRYEAGMVGSGVALGALALWRLWR